MKFSVTVEFTHMSLQREANAKVIEGSESQQLAASIWGLGSEAPLIGDFRENFAGILGRMAAQPEAKLTELRILHSVMVTYREYIHEIKIHEWKDIARMVQSYEIQVHLSEMEKIVMDVEVDGIPMKQTFRKIDMEVSPNTEGNVARLDEITQAPKRRMRLRPQTND